MEIEKLTIKHLAPYLPYGLKMYYADNSEYHIENLTGLTLDGTHIEQEHCPFGDFKPVLRPLSEIKGEYLAEIFNTTQMTYGQNTINHFGIKNTPYQVMEILLKHHFDVFNLIEKGLAVNINEIKENAL